MMAFITSLTEFPTIAALPITKNNFPTEPFLGL